MSDLRSKIIHLAHATPSLRDHLLPLLEKTATEDPLGEAKEFAALAPKHFLAYLPVAACQVYTLGGAHRPSVSLSVSMDDKASWTNGIYENSHYARFMLHWPERTIEHIAGNKLVGKFRKTRFKDIADALRKLDVFLKSQTRLVPKTSGKTASERVDADLFQGFFAFLKRRYPRLTDTVEVALYMKGLFDKMHIPDELAPTMFLENDLDPIENEIRALVDAVDSIIDNQTNNPSGTVLSTLVSSLKKGLAEVLAYKKRKRDFATEALSVIKNNGQTLLSGIRIQSLCEEYDLTHVGFWDENLMEMFNHLAIVANDEKKEKRNPMSWVGLQKALIKLKSEE